MKCTLWLVFAFEFYDVKWTVFHIYAAVTYSQGRHWITELEHFRMVRRTPCFSLAPHFAQRLVFLHATNKLE